ncbi:hypothetical protein COCSUDRAFT_59422 [Coccomyxa subellipsoidea C-169]|uniref:ribonuclease Z n=1 Tax=Coccomyxa subellipsoidea (strain C-169) TaxID=574566 RepID=I0Z8F1_COCSC|nr:hypothetical protein COCSUDRAFT_59422 [Coccomyxa subellipsoidea C-169]EIE26920.1 hypothetical protein COCSUDRAFT_59422 [Coccomyxa subellipsoidea C-169]|eukprot:XP_005651464.1 hypothetical protein COCSUDRAFT_59422 [Coccomyxa subellipsoidea C-169]
MQYLFNAPEGYARLVLEHKTRPSAKLRALFVVQPQALDAHIAVIALHASHTGWVTPEWLTQLGSKSFDAPKTLAASNEDACHTSADPSGSMCSSSSDEDLVSADSSSAASDSSSEDVDAPQERLEAADGGPEASSATMDQPAAGADNPAFQQLDQLLMLHSTRQSIFQVLKQQQQANAATSTAENNSRQQEQLLEQLEKSKPEGPLPLQQAAQVLASRQPRPPATKGTDAGTQGAFSALEQGGNPVYVQQGKQRTSGMPQRACALLGHLKASNHALLVVDCPDPAQRRLLSSHPAMKQLQSASRFVSTLHLSTAAAVRTSAYGDWAKHLPGQQIFACDAKSGDGPELGYIASARNLAKLNVISPAVYPLPAAMTAPSGEDIFIPDEPEEPDAAANAEDAVEEVDVTKELLSSRPALQQLFDRLQGSPLSKPFTHLPSQPSAAPQQPPSDLSFLGPAALPIFRPEAAIFVPAPAAAANSSWLPLIPPHPPPSHRPIPLGHRSVPPVHRRPPQPPPHRHRLIPLRPRPPPPEVLPGPIIFIPPSAPAIPAGRIGRMWGAAMHRPPQLLARGARRPQLRPWQPPAQPLCPVGASPAGGGGIGDIFCAYGGGPKTHPHPAGDGDGWPAKRHRAGKQSAASQDVQMADAKANASNRGAAAALRQKVHGSGSPPERQDELHVREAMDIMDISLAVDGGADSVLEQSHKHEVAPKESLPKSGSLNRPAFVEDLGPAESQEAKDMQQPGDTGVAENGEAMAEHGDVSKGQERVQGRPSGSAAELDEVMEEAAQSIGHQSQMPEAEKKQAEKKQPDQKQAKPVAKAAGPVQAQEAARAAAKNVPKMIVACPAGSPATPECLKAMAARGDAAQVLFLGTGCAEPSKYRGGAAVHVRLSDGRGLLLDAGEGALGQLVRHFGPAGAVDALCSVWLSHKHADHILGLPGILHARSASSPPLLASNAAIKSFTIRGKLTSLVIGPSAAQRWLAEAAQALQLRYHFVHCRNFDADGGMVSWQSVPVEHCADAYGLVMRHICGWSLVYSGDSRPCRRLQDAGRGCTLLVHEATFEPALHSQAAQKRHSTTEEALRVAARMGAYRVPVGLPTTGPLSEMVACACDGMRVPLMLLPELPKLMPHIAAALGEEPAAKGSTALHTY